MAYSFSVSSGIAICTQSGTETSLTGISTAITNQATVARSTAYTVGALVKPPASNGMWYRCSTAGTTSGTVPLYNPLESTTTTDGTAVFTSVLAPIVRTLGTQNHYYMPAFRMAINGSLTIANPQIENFTCWDTIQYGAASIFRSGTFASDGVTPLYDAVHFTATRVSVNNSDNGSGGYQLQNNAQSTFIGGEIQVAGAIGVAAGTTLRSYYTRWRGTKQWGGVSSTRIRAYSTTSIFRNCEFYDIAYDLFQMPAEFSVKARKCEYVAQYVGSVAGGVDAYFKASALENVDGVYDFDNYGNGYVELFNCAKGANLNVVTQLNATMCTPLYQDLQITAKDTTGVAVPDVRFTCTDVPNNSPTQTFTTRGGLKIWDFRNPLSYQTTTNASGIALSSPILQVWYYSSGLKKNLRFPLSTATYEGRAYNFKTMTTSVVLGSNSIQDVTAGMISLDTPTTVTETVASAITGISLVPSGTTGGVITISSNKSLQDVWNYYRYWISQFANKTSNDTWTCTGGILDSKLWTLVVNSGVTLSGTSEITQYKTSGTVTNNGTITAVYGDVNGTSTIWEFGATAEPIIAGTSLAIYDASGVTKYYNAVTTDGVYRYYIPPQATGATYTYAIEKYGTKREEGTFPSNAGGILFYVPSYGEDVGITETNLATVQGYTTLSTTSQIYDATANFRLSETGIKLGQLVARDGTFLDFGNYNVKIKDDASAIVSVASGIITYKSLVINESLKYNAMKATPPKTITVTDNELINVLIEDANGDSQLTILGGDNLGYELWKVTTATATDDYATGTLLTTLATNALPYRFIGISGYDIVGRDVSSGVRRRSSMLKGSYTQAFYVGNQIQLATDAPQLVENNEKLSEVITKLDAKLDVAVSTRLSEIDYVAPHNTEIDAIKLKVDTLENTDLTGIATATNVTDAKDEIIAELANIDVDLTGIATTQNVTDAKDEIIAELANVEVDLTGVALEVTSQEIKTKVDTLSNYDDSTAQSKLDAIKTKTDVLVNTDLTGIATTQNVTDAQTAIEDKIDAIPTTDLTGVEADLNVINEGVQKASLFIPHTTDL